MKVTIGVQTEAQIIARAVAAINSHREAETAYITFLSTEQLFRTLTPMRWQIIQEMTGAGPMSTRELARRVGRDVRQVDEDVHALLNTGVLDRTDNGAVVFPYDAVHVDFTLTAAESDEC